MIFSVVMLLLLLVVAYFHWLQGLVSATFSAICAVVAVLLAFSLYEPVVAAINPGKFADSAPGMVLIGLFAVTYLVLRILLDIAVPGNVRFHSLVDKIGGAVMGLIAGILATGLICVAAQSMPFGPSIAGYSRYLIRAQQHVIVKTTDVQNDDRQVYDQLVKPRIDGPDVVHDNMLLPVDDWVVGLVNFCSNASMSGSQPWSRIHPNYLQELFGNRIGIEAGAKRSANPVGTSDAAKLLGVYKVDSIPQSDAEYPQVVKLQTDDTLPKVLKPDGDKTLLVVRIQFTTDATDTDSLTRVSTGSVRLVVPVAGVYHNAYPLGAVDAGKVLMVSAADDYLFLKPDKAADFLFQVETSALPDTTQLPAQIPADSELFVEAKRYGRFSLGGKQIERLVPSDQVEVMRKKSVAAAITSNDPEALRKRLIGDWSTSANGQATIVSFQASGDFVMTVQSGDTPLKVTGKWSVQSAGPEGLKILRTLDSGGQPQEALVSWQGPNDDSATLKDLGPSGQTLQLQRK